MKPAVRLPGVVMLLGAAALAACQTDTGPVVPSPTGSLALAQACRAKLPDVVPAIPLRASVIVVAEGAGSAADAAAWLREGFHTAIFPVSQATIDAGTALPPQDARRWGMVPLTGSPGLLLTAVARAGAPGCAAFEGAVRADPGGGDPGRWLASPLYPDGPAGERGWCIAADPIPVVSAGAMMVSTRITSERTGDSSVHIRTDQIADAASDAIMARRTTVWLSRTSFPIGVNAVQTGCDGRNLPPLPEFSGDEGVALRPVGPAHLVAR